MCRGYPEVSACGEIASDPFQGLAPHNAGPPATPPAIALAIQRRNLYIRTHAQAAGPAVYWAIAQDPAKVRAGALPGCLSAFSGRD